MNADHDKKIVSHTDMDAISKNLDAVLLQKLQLKSIKCPKYYTVMVRGEDINRCFVSDLEPETLIPLLSDYFDKFTDVAMGWRMDVGMWTTHRRVKSNGQLFSFSLIAPGLSEDTRNDLTVKNYKSVAIYFIGKGDVK